MGARNREARAHRVAGRAPHPPYRLLGHFVVLSSTQSSERLWYRAVVDRICFFGAPGSAAISRDLTKRGLLSENSTRDGGSEYRILSYAPTTRRGAGPPPPGPPLPPLASAA